MAEDNDDSWYEREALHFAAGYGDLVRVKKLLAEGYPVSAFDDLSRTPLHYAARGDHLEIVRYLISMGADVNAHEEELARDTVLKDVAQTCSPELAKILPDAGADPTLPGWMRITALDVSATRASKDGKEVHRLLLEAATRLNLGWPRNNDFLDKQKI